MRKFVQYSLMALVFILSLVCPEQAQATDFSDNPFLDSQKRLLRSRGQATLFNIGSTGANTGLVNNYQIGIPNSGVAVDDTTSNTSLFSTPFAFGGIAPYAFRPYGFRRPYWGGGYRPGWGGYGGFGMNPAMLGVASGINSFSYAPYAGGFGRPGFGWGGYGYGYRGYGWGGLYNPAGAALTMGAFGNWADNNELGEMGYTGPIVEGPPSKSSGNYYSPSTPDPTAAGNYYSTNAPSIKMPIKPYTSPKSYWGSSGSPLPKDINKVPW